MKTKIGIIIASGFLACANNLQTIQQDCLCKKCVDYRYQVYYYPFSVSTQSISSTSIESKYDVTSIIDQKDVNTWIEIVSEGGRLTGQINEGQIRLKVTGTKGNVLILDKYGVAVLNGASYQISISDRDRIEKYIKMSFPPNGN